MFDQLDKISGGVFAFLQAFAIASLARLLWHGSEVQRGRRQWWSWLLLLELGTAVFSSIVGYGLVEQWALSGWRAAACIGVVAWLGPRGLQAAVLRSRLDGGDRP